MSGHPARLAHRTQRLAARAAAGGLLVVAALACALVLPPQIGLRPAPLTALPLVALGAVLLAAPFWPLRATAEVAWGHAARWLRWLGAALLWGVIAWCALSQPAPLTQPRSLVWSLRGLPVALAAALWLWPLVPCAWQRRAVVAVALPTLLGLALVAWSSPPRPLDFQPYYAAVDSHGTVYVSDASSPVIRVFAPNGTLRAKLRPGLASARGIPGPGFMPPGPYNDPDGLGVPRATPGSGVVTSTLQPYPFGTDDFWFMGLALDAQDRLWVPDWMRGRMLAFAPDGRLVARWPLPAGYSPSLGCVAVAGSSLYLSGSDGSVWRLDFAGHVLARWTLPEPVIGGISPAPDGSALYALARARVYRIALPAGTWSAWALPAPTGPLGQPYQAILALPGGRLLVADLAARRVDLYRADGTSAGHWGGPGAWPGQFGQVGGLARDPSGNVYVADVDHRALQRFTPAGQVNALYRSPDDDEVE
ncbi:MAG TPA: hypothetical protein VIG30_16825 [Ktedonobacterales bacterium]|jgi:hypothetical protein